MSLLEILVVNTKNFVPVLFTEILSEIIFRLLALKVPVEAPERGLGRRIELEWFGEESFVESLVEKCQNTIGRKV